MRPPRTASPPRTVKPGAVAEASAPQIPPDAPSLRRELPTRSPAEWTILAVLVSGLGLNAFALLTSSRLSRSDLILGATVLFAGLILLVLIELCRRSSPLPPD